MISVGLLQAQTFPDNEVLVFASFRTLFFLLVLHAYIGIRVVHDLPLTTAGLIAGWLMVFSIGALVPLGMAARSLLPQPWANRLTWVGMIAMGLFSSLFVFTLLRDVALLAFGWFAAVEHRDTVIEVSAMAVVGLALVTSLIGFVSARRPTRVVSVRIPLPNLPEAFEGFSIVQVSDLHVGPTIRHPFVRRVVDKVNSLHADVVALTGDFVDGSVRDLQPHVAPLSELTARHGVFMALGNHEYYAGEREWTREFRRLGIRVMLNEHVVIERNGERIVLAGVTDYSAHYFNPAHRSDPAAALRNAPDVPTRIVLAHQPRSARATAEAGFDLQLSGHTHGGQFWPWMHFVRMQQPFTAGLHRVGKMFVYVSRGTGYWGPPKRVGAPPEITHLTLVRAGGIQSSPGWGNG